MANGEYLTILSETLTYAVPEGFFAISGIAQEITWSPTVKTAGLTLTNSNYTATGTTVGSADNAQSSNNVGNSQWYMEFHVEAGLSGIRVGIVGDGWTITDLVGSGANNWTVKNGILFPGNRNFFKENWSTVTVIKLAGNRSDSTLWFGTDVHGWHGDPETNTDPAFVGLPDALYFIAALDEDASVTLATNEGSFTETVPTGYAAPTLGTEITVSILRDLTLMPIIEPPTQQWIGRFGI